MERSDLGLRPDALKQLLDSAAVTDETPGLVRPITLNVLGYVLSTGQGAAPSLDAQQLVRLYIEQTVNQPEIRDRAAPVLEKLVTDQGTKQPRAERELAAETRLRPGEVRGVLNALAAAALARPLDAAQGIWELSHDFVARAVVRYLGRQRRDLARRGAFYAAPTLLALTLLAGGGVLAWDRLAPLRDRTELAELGITVTPTAHGFVGERNSQLTAENFVKAGPLLSRLNAATPLTSLDLSYTRVADLSPLQDLPKLEKVGAGAVSEAEWSRVRAYRAAKGLPPF